MTNDCLNACPPVAGLDECLNACPPKPCEGVACHGQITLNELVKQINNLLNKDLEPIYADPRPGDVLHSFADIDLIKEKLKFQPVISFIDGLNKLAKY